MWGGYLLKQHMGDLDKDFVLPPPEKRIGKLERGGQASVGLEELGNVELGLTWKMTRGKQRSRKLKVVMAIVV